MLQLKTKFWNAFGSSLQPLLRLADDASLLGRAKHPRTVLPVPHQPQQPTTTAKIDEMLNSLNSHKQQWYNTSTEQRAGLLGQVLTNVTQLAPKLSKTGARYKGSYEGAEGEEM
jgi:hypothetical protein